MDLVEIRKKAKGRKPEEKPVRKAQATEPVMAPETERPLTPPPIPEKPLVEPLIPVGETSLDALDALFKLAPDMTLATEESYLQGLEDRVKSTDEGRQQWLTFGLGVEQYAVDIRYVREIIKPREITDIPRVPAFILGIISLRGLIVPIYDLRCRLNLGRGQLAQDRARIVVCEQGDRIAGLLVDHITQVVKFAKQEIEPPPATLSGLDRELVEGVGRIEKKMVILLDLPSVLDAELK